MRSFSAFSAPKFGQLRSKTRLESVSTSKNVNFHQTLRLPIPQRYLEPQDGLQNVPRSAQDGPKRLLKTNFFALEHRLKFGIVLAPILIDLGSRLGSSEPKKPSPHCSESIISKNWLLLVPTCLHSPSQNSPKGLKIRSQEASIF